MIATLSFASWVALRPIANHLWQSTLCAVVAGLMTLGLKRNHAQVRYWTWLVATVKFLLPFSLLIWLATHLGFTSAPVRPQPAVSLVMHEISQPFSSPVIQSTVSSTTPKPAVGNPAPALLLVVWLCGCIVVLIGWWVRWRRVGAAATAGIPLLDGREIEALRRFSSKAGIKDRIEILSSPGPLEPGVLGSLRPVLLLPAGLSDRLADDQLETIIGHEVCHASRRDNLASTILMAVESIFWFHPLVWWMGGRLIEERERACDEELLRLGYEPQVYAESILNVCKYYLESPLSCVAGVTGPNLKKRLERIMNYRAPKNLNLTKKLLMAAVGVALFAVVVAANNQFRDEFDGKLQPGWQWIDPLGDSRMSLDARPGFLRIIVTGYHDLWPPNRNWNAPRLMREVRGNFTIETKMEGPSRWCGGLLVWKDQNNYVRLERGIHFKNELSFERVTNGDYRSLAFDYAPGDPTWLRLTREGTTFTAAYSFNGAEWLPLKRLWLGYRSGFRKQPPQVEDGRSMLAEDDLIFEPGVSSAEMTASDPLLAGVSGIVPAVPPPVGLKQTVTDYDYFVISNP